ncbi:MAG: DUF2177 family protein [Candidatus Neomarinimicrobiota bacterium]
MNTKKLALSFLAGAVAMTLLGFLWHQVIMSGFYDEQLGDVLRSEPNVAFVVLGYLVLALLMAYIYPIGYKGGSPTSQGLKFGILMGLIWVLPHGLVYVGVLNFTLTYTIVDGIWHVVEEGVGGVVIGLLYGTGTEKESD